MGLFNRPKGPGDAQRPASSSDAQRPASNRVWGHPRPCPECGAPGYLDHIDMIDLVMYERCPLCGHQWQETRSEIESC